MVTAENGAQTCAANAAGKAVTVPALWRECRAALEAAGIENAAAETGWLWQAALGTERHLMRPDEVVDAPKAAALRRLIARRAAHEPVQYLLGSWPFLDFEVKVAPGVLIPRQDTECVAEQAIMLGRQLLAAGAAAPETAESSACGKAAPLWLDLCSGSGILALALAVHLRVPVTAVELSEEALPILKENAKNVCAQFAVPPVRVEAADVFAYTEALADGSAALIVSNPPYLTGQEMTQLQPEVTHEPAMALAGGGDGLKFYRFFAQTCRQKLMPDGALVLEIGAAQGEAVCSLLHENGWRDVRLYQDAAGRDRCITARR